MIPERRRRSIAGFLPWAGDLAFVGQERLIDVAGTVVWICKRHVARQPLPHPRDHLRAIVARLTTISARRFGGNAAPDDQTLPLGLKTVRPDLIETYRKRLRRFLIWELAVGKTVDARSELDRARDFFDADQDIAALDIACRIIERNGDAVFRQVTDFVRRFGSDPVFPALLPDEPVTDVGHLCGQRRYLEPDTSRVLLKDITQRYADNPHWWWLYIDTLIMTGRLDEAGPILDTQKQRFPQEPSFVFNSGVLAYKREDWDGAIAHFEAHRAISPNSPETREYLARAIMERNAARGESDADRLDVLRQDVGREDNDLVRTMLLGFESIGCDCEFGLVQRRFGAEPLGLFRWNSTDLDTLADALRLDLDGLGDAANTVMSIWQDFEYYMSDSRWGFGFHTFTSKHEVEADKLYPKMIKRLTYLRGKFLEDLRLGEKIFVFKARSFDKAKVVALHEALRRHGPVRLLCVTTPEQAVSAGLPDVSVGQVREMAEDLYLGVISRFGNGAGKWTIEFDAWTALCRAVESNRTVV